MRTKFVTEILVASDVHRKDIYGEIFVCSIEIDAEAPILRHCHCPPFHSLAQSGYPQYSKLFGNQTWPLEALWYLFPCQEPHS
jgi:hypothetical protein